MEKLPCINCLLLGRCKAELFDQDDDMYGDHHKSVTLNKLMNECCLLSDYVTIHVVKKGIEYDTTDTDKIPLVVDYLISGIEHEDPV